MIKVNFLPYRLYRRNARLKRLYVFLFVGFLIGVGISFAMKRAAEYYLSDMLEVSRVLNDQIKMQEGTFQKIKVVKKDIEFYENKLKDFESLVSRRYETVILLKELVSIVPENSFLKQFSVKNKDISIEGFANNNSVISLLIERINKSKVMRFVALRKINSIQIGGRIFQHFDISAISLL